MLWLLFWISLSQAQNEFSKANLRALRDETQEMFYHGYNNYLEHAFPADELKPISCKGRTRDEGRGTLDDSLGNFALTLVDSLDTLLVFGDTEGFEHGLKLIVDNVKFNNDVTVSLFETTIRVLGGLLSSHLLIYDRNLSSVIPWYDGQLLRMARDLGDRLLPAFDTKTGVPYSRINLKHGIHRKETDVTCTACAGTLLLEFGLLSRLTGDTKYEESATRAMKFILKARSEIGLYGSMINTTTGMWTEPLSSIGAGTDSFYEYIWKAYLYLDLDFSFFVQSYKSVMTYLRTTDDWFLVSNMFTGHTAFQWIDSLSAFWPGLQVDIGDIEAAQRGHKNYYSLWQRYHGLPERYSIYNRATIGGMQNYPLRPEFIESTYFLYRATKDPQYLAVGKTVLNSLRKYRVKCGFASVSDVETLTLEDRMDSFFLTETLKYLYLLFDENNFVHKSHYLFTTEAHVFPMSLPFHRQAKVGNASCPPYKKIVNTTHLIPPNKDAKPTYPITPFTSVPAAKASFHISGIERHTIGQFGVMQVEGSREVVVGLKGRFSDEIESLNGTIYGQLGGAGGWHLFGEAAEVQVTPADHPDIHGFFGPVLQQPVSGPLVFANPPHLCGPSTIDLTGKIVLVQRGHCTFYEKGFQAQQAGALGVMIWNNQHGTFTMTGEPGRPKISIPAVMVSNVDGLFLQGRINETNHLVHEGDAPAFGVTPRVGGSPQKPVIHISPKNYGKSRHNSFLQFLFKGTYLNAFRNLVEELEEEKQICSAVCFATNDYLLFSINTRGVDLSNSRIDVVWGPETNPFDLKLSSLVVEGG